MSIQSEIDRINNNVQSTLSAIAETGVEVGTNSDALPAAAAALANEKAGVYHTHTKSQITDFPSTMPPSSHTHKKSEITDFPSSMPASDVYSWAKAASKPSYTASEVGAQPAGNYAKTDAANTYNGEQKFANSSYCPTITDSASGVGCAFKASRGLANEMLVDKLIMTASTGKLPIYKYTGTSGGAMTGLTEVAAIHPNGSITIAGNDNHKIYGTNSEMVVYGNKLLSLYTVQTNGDVYGLGIAYGTDGTDGALRPNSSANQKISLGLSNRRFKTAYLVTAANVSSDRNIKENVKEIDERYIEFFDKLEPVSYELIGPIHDRVHLGFISQDVKAAMDEVGLTDLDFGGYCRDAKMKYDEEIGVDVPVLDKDGNPVYEYSLRYGEFIALNSKMIQLNRETIKAQQEEIGILKNELAELKSMAKAITDGEG